MTSLIRKNKNTNRKQKITYQHSDLAHRVMSVCVLFEWRNVRTENKASETGVTRVLEGRGVSHRCGTIRSGGAISG